VLHPVELRISFYTEVQQLSLSLFPTSIVSPSLPFRGSISWKQFMWFVLNFILNKPVPFKTKCRCKRGRQMRRVVLLRHLWAHLEATYVTSKQNKYRRTTKLATIAPINKYTVYTSAQTLLTSKCRWYTQNMDRPSAPVSLQIWLTEWTPLQKWGRGIVTGSDEMWRRHKGSDRWI
jgi:hypothetical protein